MNITMLGTGNAMVTECYNTCFVLQDGEKHLLVDGGGGNTLLRQLKQAGFRLEGHAGDFCDTQACRPSDGNYLDDPHDLPEYETGTV